jgi:hypothetical protein
MTLICQCHDLDFASQDDSLPDKCVSQATVQATAAWQMARYTVIKSNENQNPTYITVMHEDSASILLLTPDTVHIMTDGFSFNLFRVLP